MQLVRMIRKRQREEKEMLQPGLQRGAGSLFPLTGCRGDHAPIQKEDGVLV